MSVVVLRFLAVASFVSAVLAISSRFEGDWRPIDENVPVYGEGLLRIRLPNGFSSKMFQIFINHATQPPYACNNSRTKKEYRQRVKDLKATDEQAISMTISEIDRHHFSVLLKTRRTVDNGSRELHDTFQMHKKGTQITYTREAFDKCLVEGLSKECDESKRIVVKDAKKQRPTVTTTVILEKVEVSADDKDPIKLLNRLSSLSIGTPSPADSSSPVEKTSPVEKNSSRSVEKTSPQEVRRSETRSSRRTGSMRGHQTRRN